MEGGIPPYLLIPTNYMSRMRHLLLFTLAFSAFFISSCVKEHSFSDIETKSGKIINEMTVHDDNSLMFKLYSSADEGTIGNLASKGLTNVRKVFKSTPGKEELEARFGLDRWYIGDIAEDGVLSDVAESLAADSEVALVQYNTVAAHPSDGNVFPMEEIEPLTKADPTYPFNDPSLKDQWHYWNQGNASIATSAKKGADINVIDTWRQLTCGDPSIIVAVVDEGVKHTHPDLKANMWVNEGEIPGNGIDDDGNGYIDDVYGYNFTDNGPISWNKEGDSGHGTHCAGTIAAVNNNGVGVAGVAGGSGKGDGCKIMSCQIFSGNGGGATYATANAIKYAADMGASIISCSFGYSFAYESDNHYIKSVGSVELDAIHYFEASKNNDVIDGGIAIFAAGNSSHNYAHYPGAFNDIISVTAFGPDFLPTYYTNYGPGCNICAPGGEIGLPPMKSYKSMVLSTLPSEITGVGEKDQGKYDYGYMQGTSMACPHVSGVVALGLSYAKKLGKKFTKQEFKDMILTSANDMDTNLKGEKTYVNKDPLNLAQFYHKLGTGSIDTWLLMMKIEGIPCLTAETGVNQWLDLSDHFGTASPNLTYLGLEISDECRNSLGLVEEPYIQYGRLFVHPTKVGSGKITVRAIGGGEILGGGDNPPGGMEVKQEISIVSRAVRSINNGWL